MQQFYKAVQRISKLSDDDFGKLEKICTQKSLKKNEFLLKEGDICNEFYYISNGLVRIYYSKHDKDISEWFAIDDSFCFSIKSFFQQIPSSLVIQCIEDSTVITISHDGLEHLRKTNLEIANFAFELISRPLIASQERMQSMLFETALQRYEHLFKEHNKMLQRVPLNYLASFLGVTAETLSRIRAQVH